MEIGEDRRVHRLQTNFYRQKLAIRIEALPKVEAPSIILSRKEGGAIRRYVCSLVRETITGFLEPPTGANNATKIPDFAKPSSQVQLLIALISRKWLTNNSSSSDESATLD